MDGASFDTPHQRILTTSRMCYHLLSIQQLTLSWGIIPRYYLKRYRTLRKRYDSDA